MTLGAGLTLGMLAQEVSRTSKADLLKRDDVVRGQALFQSNCAACHGANAGGGMGPNLMASTLVRHDVMGSAIGQVLHEGRMDKGMPAFPNLTPAQVTDIAAFVHARIDVSMRASALGASAFGGQLAIGDAAAGKQYFQARCASCHNPAGEFAGIAKKHDPAELLSLMLAPKSEAETATVTLPGGETVRGTVLHRDEFSTTLREPGGNVRTLDANQTDRLNVDDPLRAHRDLLKTYTNKDIHDVFAYLETLQ